MIQYKLFHSSSPHSCHRQGGTWWRKLCLIVVPKAARGWWFGMELQQSSADIGRGQNGQKWTECVQWTQQMARMSCFTGLHPHQPGLPAWPNIISLSYEFLNNCSYNMSGLYIGEATIMVAPTCTQLQ